MDEDRVLELSAETGGNRIDRLLVEHLPDFSRSAIQKMIEEGLVSVNGKSVKPNYRMRPGDQIVAHIRARELLELEAEPIPLNIVYEDDHLLVINKPAGMVVHPAFGHPGGTLVNALLSHLPDLMDEDQPDRPGIVHRLDMETSGLIVVAKSGGVRHALQAQFKGREVTKTYLALVEGQVKTSHGIIEAALGRDLRHRKRIAVVAEGRPSVTEYRVLERFEANTYLEVEPHTGRTHQIRVHLAYIGHPVVGDTVYGYRKQRLPLKRHFLHAAQLTLHHPYSGELLEWVAPLPDDLQHLLDQIRKEAQLS